MQTDDDGDNDDDCGCFGEWRIFKHGNQLQRCTDAKLAPQKLAYVAFPKQPWSSFVQANGMMLSKARCPPSNTFDGRGIFALIYCLLKQGETPQEEASDKLNTCG